MRCGAQTATHGGPIIGRIMKFPQKGWTLYNADRNTVCGMMLPELHLPVTESTVGLCHCAKFDKNKKVKCLQEQDHSTDAGPVQSEYIRFN